MSLTERNKNEEQKEEVKVQNTKAYKDTSKTELFSENQELKEQLAAAQASTGKGQGEILAVFSEMLKKMNSTTGQQSSNGNFDGYTDFREIDEADYLPEEEWVTFMAPSLYYPISDTKINGKSVRAPYGRIELKHVDQRIVRSGKEEDIFHTCAFVCKTQAELDFLKRHHLYNVTFFADDNKMKEMNVTILSKIVAIFNSMKSLDSHTLFNRCKAAGLETSTDPYQMRTTLAIHEAEKIHAREVAQLEDRNRASLIEAALVGKTLK